uniref:GBF-interacting protein 1 N-terminal domain-containing protein n=1 Tax=Davidia involucrata TaxID=16924 RepID=A0A5B7APQ9_DAVIN
MVSGSRIEGGTQILSARVRKTIQSIKEIVGNHSDADIYVALKETNMDPNETAQKLLNQDPFHEVKRRRDKKKESTVYNGSAEPRKYSEHVGQGMKFNNTYSDRNVRRGGYSRNAQAVAGISREFRVVRDNRINQNVNREMKPPLPQCSTSTNEQVTLPVSEKGSSAGTSSNQKPSGGHYSSQGLDGPTDSHPRQARDANSGGTVKKESLVERRAPVPNTVSRVHVVKPNDSQPHSATLASNNSVVGVYSSSSDPVHVPSLDSRSAATVGAIKREVGVVGVRRQSSENSVQPSSAQSSFSQIRIWGC